MLFFISISALFMLLVTRVTTELAFFLGESSHVPVLRTTVWSGMKALTAPHCRTDPGQFGPKPFRPGTPQRKSFVLLGFLGPGLQSLIFILTLTLVSKS